MLINQTTPPLVWTFSVQWSTFNNQFQNCSFEYVVYMNWCWSDTAATVNFYFVCFYAATIYIWYIYIYIPLNLWKVSRISPNWLTNRLCSLHFNGFPDDFCINEIISSNLSSERTCQCFNWMLQWWMLQLLNKYRKIMSKHQQCLFSECKLVANLDNLITFSPQ